MYNQIISDLQSPPQLFLGFSNMETAQSDSQWHSMITRRNPSNMVVLGVVGETIQTPEPQSDIHRAATILSGFSMNSRIVPFSFLSDSATVYNVERIEAYIDQIFDTATDWKLVILYVQQRHGFLSRTVSRRIRSKFPHVILVGGVCERAVVSMPIEKQESFPSVEYMVQSYSMRDLRFVNMEIGGALIPGTVQTHVQLAEHVYNEIQRKQYTTRSDWLRNPNDGGICGVALAGDIPIRIAVSCGFESFSSQLCFGDSIPRQSFRIPRQSFPFSIHDAEFDNRDMVINGERLSPNHLIRSVQDSTTGKIYHASDVLLLCGLPHLIGIQLLNEQGFLLEHNFRIPYSRSSFVLSGLANHSSIVGANVDFFKYSDEQSVNDMDLCMKELRQQTIREEVLGAVMFSSMLRCPRPGNIFHSKSDAKCWARHFPNVSCNGFYAHGEIGPRALAGRQSILQTDNISQELDCSAVVLLFMAPSSVVKENIDE